MSIVEIIHIYKFNISKLSLLLPLIYVTSRLQVNYKDQSLFILPRWHSNFVFFILMWLCKFCQFSDNLYFSLIFEKILHLIWDIKQYSPRIDSTQGNLIDIMIVWIVRTMGLEKKTTSLRLIDAKIENTCDSN